MHTTKGMTIDRFLWKELGLVSQPYRSEILVCSLRPTRWDWGGDWGCWVGVGEEGKAEWGSSTWTIIGGIPVLSQ